MIQYVIISVVKKDVNRFCPRRKNFFPNFGVFFTLLRNPTFFDRFFRRNPNMRIDKFLKVSRILKRRTVAREAADAGKIAVNGKEVKPAYRLKTGDVVEITFSSGTLRFRVLELRETVKKDEAQNLYEVLS